MKIYKVPNQLPKEAVDELRAAYEDEFDETLTDGECQEMGKRLIRFFKILLDLEKLPPC